MLVEEIEDNPLYPPRFVWDPDSSRSRSSADPVIGAPSGAVLARPLARPTPTNSTNQGERAGVVGPVDALVAATQGQLGRPM